MRVDSARSEPVRVVASPGMMLPDGTVQYGYVSTASSYLSASDKRVHFGLGAQKVAASLEIMWPSGKTQRLENVKADQVVTVKEP